jgi:hypothetical protein
MIKQTEVLNKVFKTLKIDGIASEGMYCITLWSTSVEIQGKFSADLMALIAEKYPEGVRWIGVNGYIKACFKVDEMHVEITLT